MGALSVLNKARMLEMSRLSDAYGNAMALSDAARSGKSPSEVLDSEFLVKDRSADRLMAISDMMADPMLAKQAAPGVLFALANKAMDLDPRLEQPEQRELLRVYMAKLLPQNGQVDDATIAALSTIESNLGKAPMTPTQKALLAAKELADVKGPDIPQGTGPLSAMTHTMSTGIDIPDALDMSTLENFYKDIHGRLGERAKEKKETAKALAEAEEKARKEEKALADAQSGEAEKARRDEAKLREDAMKLFGVRRVGEYSSLGGGGNIRYEIPAARGSAAVNISPSDLDKMVEVYRTSLA